ncbi:MAG: LamG-like jellyroll fold domain-containing protein, partial [Gammaproteobacteria bacterium]
MVSSLKQNGFCASSMRKIAACLFLMLAFSGQSAPAQELHYRFDDAVGATASDSSGNGHIGALTNGPGWIPGRFGSAVSFDGTNDHVATAFVANLPQWSVAFWVRSPASPAAGPANGPVHRERSFAISWDHPAAAFRGSAALSVAGTWYGASFGTLDPDTWYHLAATYDGETLSVYKNGALVATNVDPSGPPDAEPATLAVGKHAGADEFFDGEVDDLYVYASVLTLAEIQGLMAGPANPDVTAPQISNLAGSTTSTAATISWTTNEPASSRLSYGPTTALGTTISDAAFALSHSYTLTGLTPDTPYFYEIEVQDPSLNATIDNNGGLFHTVTTQQSEPAPTISNVQVTNLAASSATITWTTNVAASSAVDWGPTTSLGSNKASAVPVTSHSITLTGLTGTSTYFFTVSSTGAGGTTTDDNGGLRYSFTTPQMSSNLILYHRYDEAIGSVAMDSSGNGINGTLANGPVWIAGQHGAALSFDGVNDRVTTAFADHLPAWSVAFWVRSPASPASGTANGPVHRENNFAISWNHPAAAFRGAAAMSVGGNWYAASFGVLVPDTWYHLAATYDGETLSAYKNGLLVTANTAPSGPADPHAGTLSIGKHAVIDSYFAGDVDDLQVHGRALSTAEIVGVMAGPADPDVIPPQISGAAHSVAG